MPAWAFKIAKKSFKLDQKVQKLIQEQTKEDKIRMRTN